jgi:2-phospho-L-lactate guanylyltransferase
MPGSPVGAPVLLRYGVVVPVKRPAIAKSRLASLGDEARRALVVAFATDTVTATLESSLVARVLVVTDDPSLAAGLTELGALAVPDGEAGRLNASLVLGATELLRREPGLRPVAVCGDLPALRSDELDRVLGSAPGDRAAFVADADGTGTTLYTAPSLEQFAPHFGHRSRSRHEAAGAVELDAGQDPSVRRDVDTPSDLRDAVLLGVGARTSWVVTSMRLELPA